MPKTLSQTLNDRLATLVSMQTTYSNPKATHTALQYLADFLEQKGLYVNRYEWDGYGSIVATTHNTKTPVVMLAAHLDVMQASPEMFTMRAKDGKLFGRGVYDMKYAIAAYMEVVERLQDNLEGYDFGIMITTDEELGNKDNINGTRRLVNEGYIPKVCVLPDGAENWKLETSAKGYMHFTLEAQGKMAHGSRPWLGDNAIYKLIDALQDLREYYKDQGPDTATFNTGVIAGDGVAANSVAAYARAEIETRPPTHKAHEKLKNEIPAICNKHGVAATLRADFAPLSNSLTDPYIASFAESIQKVTGITPAGHHSLAGTDARYFVEKGVPCVITYPTGGGHHGPEEWIDEKAFHQFYEVVEDYLHKTALIKNSSQTAKKVIQTSNVR